MWVLFKDSSEILPDLKHFILVANLLPTVCSILFKRLFPAQAVLQSCPGLNPVHTTKNMRQMSTNQLSMHSHCLLGAVKFLNRAAHRDV